MKNTQIEKNPATISRSTRVTFVPLKEDYVHIASCVTAAQPRSLAKNYLYRTFLFLNLICFPAYLLFRGYLVSAFAVFIAGGIFVIFLLPESEKKAYRHFYKDLFENRGAEFEVELFEKGLWCAYNGNESLIAWKNITGIQEGPDSIYFFIKHSGVPVRKEAFESEEHKNYFVNSAREHVRSTKLGLN
jgi:hypothetical protein